MRLLVVVCVTLFVAFFFSLVVAWVAPSCHDVVVTAHFGQWCLPPSGVA